MNGKELADKIKGGLKTEVASFSIAPKLAVIQVGDNPASSKYIKMKQKAAEEVGIGFVLQHYDIEENARSIKKAITALNLDKSVAGIIVQLPLPTGLDVDDIIEAIDPSKDVDGLTSTNQRKLEMGEPGLFPATAEGVIKLLQHYDVELPGANVVVLGRSKLVGRPAARMLENEGAGVTICHSKTVDVASITRNADVVVSAVGKRNLLTADMIKLGAVVVDVGMDVEFDKVSEIAGMITPPIGGVGPMTVAMLLSNVVKAKKGTDG